MTAELGEVSSEDDLRVDPPLSDQGKRAEPSAATPAFARAPVVRQAALGAVAAVISCLLLVPLYGLRQASMGIPLFYSGDANFHGMLFKGILDHGWYYENPLLSAPAGQHFRDFPMPDNLHLAFAWTLGAVTDSYAVAMNVYFLAGFALTAVFTTLVLRRLRFSVPVSIAIGVLYSLAPYHFLRNQNHLFLASYWTVPLGVYLVMGVLGQVPLFPKRADASGPLARVTWTGVATVVMAVLVASGSAYYGAFTGVLLAAATVAMVAGTRRSRSVLPGLILVGVLFGTVLLNLTPHLLYVRSHGSNDAAAFRPPGGTEEYSLKLTQLLLPMQEHRVPAMGSLAARYLREFPIPSEPHPVGMLAALGVVAILGGLLAALTRQRSLMDERVRRLGLCTVAALLFATTGGFSSLFELLVMPILRGWNRFAIFIMLFGLMRVGLGLDNLGTRLGTKRRAAWVGICIVVTAFGVWDQTSDQFRPAYASDRASFLSDREFVGRIEAQLPAEAMVFQLPAMGFPEAGPTNDMTDYDHLRGFLHSDRLRWSYGGVKGRTTAEWPVRLADQPVSRILPKIVAVGYRGIYIDRYGYVDRGEALEGEISKLTSGHPIVSADGRLAFFDLQPYRRQFVQGITEVQLGALRRSALEPIETTWGRGFYGEEHGDGRSWRWATSSASLQARVPPGEDREVVLRIRAASPAVANGHATLRVGVAGGAPVELRLGPDPQDHVVELRLRPGSNNIVFSTDAPSSQPLGEKRDLRLQISGLEIEDAEAESALSRVRLAA